MFVSLNPQSTLLHHEMLYHWVCLCSVQLYFSEVCSMQGMVKFPKWNTSISTTVRGLSTLSHSSYRTLMHLVGGENNIPYYSVLRIFAGEAQHSLILSLLHISSTSLVNSSS